MIDPRLKTSLNRAVARSRNAALSAKLALTWAAAALLAFLVLLLERQLGWASSLTVPVLALAAIVASFIVTRRHHRTQPDYRALAQSLEKRYPELDGRLITAVQQQPGRQNTFHFLQERVLREVLRHSYEHEWSHAAPGWKLALARTAHLLALLLFIAVLAGLLKTAGPALVTQLPSRDEINVVPGDVSLERGSSLVVMARFGQSVPPGADLLIGTPDAPDLHRLPLVKSLSDPVFGGQVGQVESNFVYSVEYAGKRTRPYKVDVFEFPRLERADATLDYPEYTALEPKTIQDTRRISAVEGSQLQLSLALNKPVVSARLIPRDKPEQPTTLTIFTNQPLARLQPLILAASQTYDLLLRDADGRTNKVPARFVFDVLKNRTPELKLTSPRGDIRPSPIEEVTFDGTAWDDFGLDAFGIGYSLVGQPPEFIELGRNVPAKEKRPFHHTFSLEDLGLAQDQLISWFLWADDKDPQGELRRTPGDLFFAEIRPFEEIFREAQDGSENSGESQQSGEGSGQGGQAGQLAQIQKQILNATWNLHRKSGKSLTPPPPPKKPDRQSSTSLTPRSHALLVSWSHRLPSPRSHGLIVSSFRGLPFAQPAPARPPRNRANPALSQLATNTAQLPPDTEVVRDAQNQLLEQARQLLERQQDGRMGPLWREAAREMEKALQQLERALKDPGALDDALAAEQAAYQALLKLQEHEYQVSRSRRQQKGQQGGGQNQQMQRQLDQLDLTQSENRYETQRMARAPQDPARNEQLQILNRLQELARRQQDFNEQLKELQAALSEAKTEAEREDIRLRLKRLQEEERQMLADLDELRQRMDRPENQSQMAEQRRQLDQAREDMQRASEATARGEPSQALAAGTRAQNQLQDLRDELRRQNSSEFSEEMRLMRDQARDLTQQQEAIISQIDEKPQSRSLSDSPRDQTLQNLAQQRQRLTNIVDRATQLSEQAEASEPLMSRELYDSLRKFTQDNARDVKETEEQLLTRGLMTRDLYDRMNDATQNDGAKMLDVVSEMLRMDVVPQARETARDARESMETLRQGIERAAQSILGDDTEALRLAEQELNNLTDQLAQEIARQRQEAGQGTNQMAGATGGQPGEQQRKEQVGQRGARAGEPQNSVQANNPDSPRGEQEQEQAGQTRAGRQQGNEPGQAREPGDPNARSQPSESADSQPGQVAGGPGQGQPSSEEQNNRANSPGQRDRDSNTPRTATSQSSGGGSGPSSFDVQRDLDRFLNEATAPQMGPITGDDFVSWSDRLRDVEEMIDFRDLRNSVATARDRARVLRQEYKRDGKAPDWANVQLQIVQPLVEVRDQIRQELARRGTQQELVPLDRDPVPSRFSDMVRRYYEQLGKDK